MSESKHSKGRGCIFYGCLTGVVIFLAGAISTFFAGRYLYHKAYEYTSPAPISLSGEGLTAEKLAELQERVARFGAALREPKGRETLTLTADELNALLAQDAGLQKFRGQVRLGVEGDKITAKLSLPLEGVGWGFGGRYLNGAATARVSLVDGQLAMNLTAVEWNGTPVSESWLANLRQKNLAEEILRHPPAAEAIQKLAGIEVKDGRLILTSKAKE